MISYFLLGFVLIIFTIPTLIFLLLPVECWRCKSFFLYGIMHIFYRLVLWCTLLPSKIVGTQNIPRDPAIIVANHQSSLDVPLIGSLLKGYPHIWLAIKDLMRSPFLRFVLPRTAVLIDLKTPQTAMRSLIVALKTIQDMPCHVIVFPEGGRFTDGSIHDFYGGFVILAKKTGRPIVPIRSFNLGSVYPPGAFLAHPRLITVKIGKPMFMLDGESDEAFKERVYRWFVEQAEE
jgi:1-acyl-sn-glycerol-3-phosphate acyltransferase